MKTERGEVEGKFVVVNPKKGTRFMSISTKEVATTVSRAQALKSRSEKERRTHAMFRPRRYRKRKERDSAAAEHFVGGGDPPGRQIRFGGERQAEGGEGNCGEGLACGIKRERAPLGEKKRMFNFKERF